MSLLVCSMPHAAGHGDSPGLFRYGRYKDDAAQIRSAKLFLQARGRNVVGLLGHSKGATGAVLYASMWDDVPLVVNLAGRFHVQEGVTRRLGERVLAQLSNGQQVVPTVKSSLSSIMHHQQATAMLRLISIVPVSTVISTCGQWDSQLYPV